ncbi:S-adenosyl-L-methionine-dependent methyltransferase [Neolentinus lepideus HHB14362 ss-1]|uniref:S-adenosyl-L-methionine-dependent methyltransferase n=1 Tax=Neolentinus lepideus HHB14362 ss-1 TaxID=1314782 RepID=A0A165RXG3_9AGAM|nr:S-adenosyl-L-methionine-dependent methyltransferase [Neolentinus lepideus HHB14362 ss-1]
MEEAHSEQPRKSVKQRRKEQRKLKKARALPEPFSTEDVQWRDIVALLGKEHVDKTLEEEKEWNSPFDLQEEVELEVSTLSSDGESLSIAPSPKSPWVVRTPFALPGETIRAKIYRNSRLHSLADLIAVTKPNPELRDMNRVRCKHFGECAGCQYQMLSYDTQLDLKRNVIVKAYNNFFGLDPSILPSIEPTIASPLQYGYRTKITPHFDAPPRRIRAEYNNGTLEKTKGQPEWLKIGFNKAGTKNPIDIEECPIATSTINQRLPELREAIINDIWTYHKGVSLLLRDSLEIPETSGKGKGSPHRPKSLSSSPSKTSAPEIDSLADAVEKHVCITNHKATVRERVGNKIFDYPGHAFFQNNNSVLVPLTDYVRDAVFSSGKTSPTSEKLTHLVDAYCGSGLFAIMLAEHFQEVSGIELSPDAIKFATKNAQLNGIPTSKIQFRSGDAANIFQTVSHYPPNRTVVVIDPPRKGTDERFIKQLIKVGPKVVVYVSCNVHTQARDVGMIMKEVVGIDQHYALTSLRGFDLFPQTAHVESVAVLRLKDGPPPSS